MNHSKLKRILILGVGGFIGRNLSTYLKQKDYEVIEADITHYCACRIDALDKSQVENTLKEIRPDVVYNLIGYTNESYPEIVYRLNIFPFINVVQSIKELELPVRVITIGSAAEYGRVNRQHSPLKEDDIKLPISHYGVSKHTQTMIARLFFKSNGLDIIVARPFNILGPGMPKHAVPACFIAQFLGGETRDGNKIIRTRDLDSVRDFLTIDDVITGLHQIMVGGMSGESYNICSGKGINVHDIFNIIAGIFTKTKYILNEEKENRNSGNIPWSIGDNSKLIGLGWKPEGSIDDEIRKMVDIMRGELKGNRSAG